MSAAPTTTMTRAETEPAETAAAPVAPAKSNRARTVRLVLLAALVVGAVYGVMTYLGRRGVESTDDAQVEAEIVSVPARVGGVVVRVLVAENQAVEAGQVLVELDDAQAKARLAQAEAELAAAKAGADSASAGAQVIAAAATGGKSAAEASVLGASAGLSATADEIAQAKAAVQAAQVARDQAKSDLERFTALVSSGSATQVQLDAAKSTFDAAEARLAQANAALAGAKSSTTSAAAKVNEAKAHLTQASAIDAQIAEARAKSAVAAARVQTAQAMRDLAALDLGYTKIVAPRAGIASRKTALVGQMLAPGQPVLMIVPAAEAWITANFKETQLEKMKIGQPVEIAIDAFPDKKLHGVVESFSGATGARFSLLPPDNSTGNYTKVVQRVPVKIKLDAVPTDVPLRPGMSVDVSVDTRK